MDAGKFIADHGSETALLKTIDDLRKQQKEQAGARKKLTKELRNAQKAKGQGHEKARELSNEDLVEVMRFRARVAGKEAEPVAAHSHASKHNGEDESRPQGQEGDTGA